MEIFEAGKPIGTITADATGLFWEFCCIVTERPERLRRIFVQNGWQVEYLGIPDRNGILKGRIPQKRMSYGITNALATQRPKGEWLPWQGKLDGVQVENACIRVTQEGIDLALFPEEILKFPAWADIIKTENILGKEMAVLSLDKDGRLPVKDIEIGGNTDETMDCNALDLGLPDEPVACNSGGSEGDEEQGWETHCPDL